MSVAILDQNDTVAAIQSAEINMESRVISGSHKPISDGAVVRVL